MNKSDGPKAIDCVDLANICKALGLDADKYHHRIILDLQIGHIARAVSECYVDQAGIDAVMKVVLQNGQRTL